MWPLRKRPKPSEGQRPAGLTRIDELRLVYGGTQAKGLVDEAARKGMHQEPTSEAEALREKIMPENDVGNLPGVRKREREALFAETTPTPGFFTRLLNAIFRRGR